VSLRRAEFATRADQAAVAGQPAVLVPLFMPWQALALSRVDVPCR